jgi:hypothetical protein
MAASRNEWWRFSVVAAGASKGGRRINNPPQVKQPAPQIVAAREECDG